MPRLMRIVQCVAVVTVVISYSIVSHHYTVAQSADYGAILSIAPIMVIALGLAWRSSIRFLMLALLGLTIALLIVYRDVFLQNYSWVYFIEHAGINLFLCLMFGSSLLDGRQPLCTVWAGHFHGKLSLARIRYTRQVTIAWTVYFAVMVMVSVLLFFLGPVHVWSVFASFLTPIFLVLMFVGEYMIRLRVVPAKDHATLLQSLRAFRELPPSSLSRNKAKISP